MSEQYLTIHYLNREQLANLFSKIQVSPTHSYNGTPCWEWQGAKSDNGYGVWAVHRRNERVHRVLYAWLVAPIPRGLGRNIPQLDHLCNNKSCANPTHLSLKTAWENNKRGQSMAAIHARKTHCKNGHEYTPDNTYRIKTDSRRICRKCTLQRQKEEYAKRKVMA